MSSQLVSMPSMRRSRRPRAAQAAGDEGMVARERRLEGWLGEKEVEARRRRRRGGGVGKGFGGARRRRKAAARETGGDKVGRRVAAMRVSVLASQPRPRGFETEMIRINRGSVCTGLSHDPLRLPPAASIVGPKGASFLPGTVLNQAAQRIAPLSFWPLSCNTSISSLPSC